VTTLLLAAVLGAGGKTGVAFAADHLFAVEGLGESGKGGVNDAATKAEHEVESRLLLDVVVGEGAAVLELLAGEDETLLIRRDSFLVLNLCLDIISKSGYVVAATMLDRLTSFQRSAPLAKRQGGPFHPLNSSNSGIT